MLRVKLMDKIRNSVIRSGSKVVDIIERIDHLKKGWTGHILHSPIDKWSKRSPCGRVYWKQLDEAYARRHIETRNII
ncbi:unnamed protein product [Euphydryas editha]|uniref:Uncharacterized protein n=1 Tax=Euphydryas editha TaxID=104508 RepID=A0AAU9TSW2_EUPED|nr:unnamed protein product [Euphydryas editha]